MENGLFDHEFRLKKIDSNGDPLKKINETINWELFRPELETINNKKRKNNAGRKCYDQVLMFKIIILQTLYNLSDDETENQILDRLSFSRFLGLSLGDTVPDAKTIWLFKELMNESNLAETLFNKFNEFLYEAGFQAKKGQIVDAVIMEVPKQRNTKEENKMIKDGEIEQVKKEWSPEKSAQKDTDARWTKKHGKNYFGFKMHTSVDVKHKFIRKFTVTPANVHDSQEFMNVLSSNTNVDIYGDSAYRSQEDEELMKEYGFRSKIQYKGSRSKPLTEKQRETNSIRAKVRARVEHVFGTMRQCMGSTLIRSVGLVRAKIKIGLRCLAYNFKRFTFLSGGIV